MEEDSETALSTVPVWLLEELEVVLIITSLSSLSLVLFRGGEGDLERSESPPVDIASGDDKDLFREELTSLPNMGPALLFNPWGRAVTVIFPALTDGLSCIAFSSIMASGALSCDTSTVFFFTTLLVALEAGLGIFKWYFSRQSCSNRSIAATLTVPYRVSQASKR